MATVRTAIHLPVSPLPRTASARRIRFEVGLATKEEREAIYTLRHEVYAREIGQHPTNAHGRLTDALDEVNRYLVARCDGELAGFVSITPPAMSTGYSIDKYFRREELPFAVDGGLFEVRLLTVQPKYRGSKLAALLMYAAFRWVEAHGGTHLAAIGRREVLSVY